MSVGDKPGHGAKPGPSVARAATLPATSISIREGASITTVKKRDRRLDFIYSAHDLFTQCHSLVRQESLGDIVTTQKCYIIHTD